MLPLYTYVLFGYIAGKKLDAHLDTIAKLMFYLITPIIVFNGTLHTPITANVLSVPVLTYLFACSMCLLFYQISRRIWSDSSKNIIAFSAGSGATGYFGIPLAMLLFSPEKEGLYIMSLLGVTLYDYSVGYYISSKGSYSAMSCLYRVVKLPTLYAFALGLFLNYFSIEMPVVYHDFIGHIRGVYTVLGMMIVGVGIAGVAHITLDYKFIAVAFIAKFIVWPLLVFSFVWIDISYLHWYGSDIHHALTLISIVPIAVNTVMMASMANSHPEKASLTVLLSTLFALVYIPLMVNLLLPDL